MKLQNCAIALFDTSAHTIAKGLMEYQGQRFEVLSVDHRESIHNNIKLYRGTLVEVKVEESRHYQNTIKLHFDLDQPLENEASMVTFECHNHKSSTKEYLLLKPGELKYHQVSEGNARVTHVLTQITE